MSSDRETARTHQALLESTLLHSTAAPIGNPASEEDHRRDSAASTQASPSRGTPGKRMVDKEALGDLLLHPSTRAFEVRIGISIADLWNRYLLDASPSYDSLCFCRPEWQPDGEPGKYGNYYTRSEILHIVLDHVLKRISCLSFVELDGYKAKDGLLSSTDAAVAYVVKILINASTAVISSSGTADIPALSQQIPGHGTTVMIADRRAIRALEIFTQHPMKFKVQKKDGQNLQPEEWVVIWCEDTDNHGWTLTWEYMSKNCGRCLVPAGNYLY